MDAVIDALATYRLTRLVTTDRLTRTLRGRVVQAAYEWRDGFASEVMTPEEWLDRAWSDDEAPLLAELVRCAWCVGVWAGLGVAAARTFAPRAWSPVARALAYAAVAGVASRSLDGE